ncbi:hypothetical protein ABEB36_013228 [Hypothenemus hampei]|uniref:Macro domain-containing protein n=1 Tax=Hypothenemus hampei TaxID=57062 RepID=A0ABD1E797_HYPHA
MFQDNKLYPSTYSKMSKLNPKAPEFIPRNTATQDPLLKTGETQVQDANSLEPSYEKKHLSHNNCIPEKPLHLKPEKFDHDPIYPETYNLRCSNSTQENKRIHQREQYSKYRGLNKPNSPSKFRGDSGDIQNYIKNNTQKKESPQKTSQERKPQYSKIDQVIRNPNRKSTPHFESKKLEDPRMVREKSSNKPVSKFERKYTNEDDSCKNDYENWEKNWNNVQKFTVVKEINADLFDQSLDFSLAHCVAEDLRMGSGIATTFKYKFKNLPQLLDQNPKQGGLAILKDNNRYIYYLVTKRESSEKPTYPSLWKSLIKMRDHINRHKIKKLAIPLLGCGRDRLDWNRVKAMIQQLFEKVDIEILVCKLQQDEQENQNDSKCPVVIEDTSVNEIEFGTLLLYFTSTTGNQDKIMHNMLKKFQFLESFQTYEPKKLGDIIYFDDKKQNYGLCGCVVRKTESEPISFESLHECIKKINNMNRNFGKTERFNYVAFQWVNESNYLDDLINQKLITMFSNLLDNVQLHVCKGSFS